MLFEGSSAGRGGRGRVRPQERGSGSSLREGLQRDWGKMEVGLGRGVGERRDGETLHGARLARKSIVCRNRVHLITAKACQPPRRSQ